MAVDERLSAGGRVVVGVDGSRSSHEALRWGRFLAESLGATLEAVTAWQPMYAYSWATAGWAAISADWDPAAEAQKMLSAAVDEVFGPDRPPDITRRSAKAWRLTSCSEQARVPGCLWSAVAATEASPAWVLGSVSAACAEHAGCPVLVAHGNTDPPAELAGEQ
jgi:nucleotide-binding universal stress UspA family protein